MALGNKGFADIVAGSGSGGNAATRLPPRTGILAARENRLAELAAGTTLTRVHEAVDPLRCRIWGGHNRDYGALTPENCADLIESLRAQGRQEVPAIVRRVAGDPACDFEVICGARRHFSVSWLRAHNFPEFRFLVEPRELTDEEAFRIADLENRNRKDLSDYERATDYASAVERYYDGSQQRMAERLNVSRSWLSRYLELARLPPAVTGAFGSPHVIGISHGAVLAPLLRVPPTAERMSAAAAALAAEQVARVKRGEALLPPATVVRQLAMAAKAQAPRAPRLREHAVHAADGTTLARGQLGGRGGALTITVPAPKAHDRAELLAALGEILDRIGGLPSGRQ